MRTGRSAGREGAEDARADVRALQGAREGVVDVRAPVAVRCDELLYDAFMAYRAADELARAEQVRRTFLDPKNGVAKSPLVKQLDAP